MFALTGLSLLVGLITLSIVFEGDAPSRTDLAGAACAPFVVCAAILFVWSVSEWTRSFGIGDERLGLACIQAR
jgi:hypothetical protein